MTSINDLPPELLYRILYLAAEGEGYRRQFILQDTSAVARSWRSPSQELLLTEISLSAIYPAKTIGFAARLKDFRLREVRRMTVDRFTKEDMEVATEGVRSLGYLRIEGDHAPFPAGCLSVKLLSGLKSLELRQEISGVFLPPPPNLLLPLRHLSLTAEYGLPAATLTSLLAWASNVTSLDLHCGGAAYTHSWIQQHNPLTVLGPQLRHLSLRHPPSSMESENDDAQTGLVGSLAAGLPTCVNLRSLEVISVKQGQLAQVLASLSSPLELLETGVHRYSAQELVRLLELPALAKLKRWRVPRFRMMTLEGWEGACESRGVEARGENRFFTDRCYE